MFTPARRYLLPDVRDPQRTQGEVRVVSQQVADHAAPLARLCYMAELLVARLREVVVEAGDSADRVQQVDAVAVEAAAVVHDEWRSNGRYHAISRSHGNIHLVGLPAANCRRGRLTRNYQQQVAYEKERPSWLILVRGGAPNAH